uniref:aralkylamine N-acetyltransferase n=1 Tax=Clastoptera arizonana TaxID=38151 RepID=A0A1B6CV67_9HEMI
MDDIEFVTPIPENRYEDVIIHLRKNFFADEPLNASVTLCAPGEGHAELEEHSLSTLRCNLSIMAVQKDTDEVIAVSLNGIQNPGDIEVEMKKLENLADERFKQIFSLLYGINQSLDLFSKYNVDRILEGRILSVDSAYRGKGLAKQLVKRTEDIARTNNFKLVKYDTTGLFSQRICSVDNYETIYELKYTDYVNESGDPIFIVPAPHEYLKIMIKQLE